MGAEVADAPAAGSPAPRSQDPVQTAPPRRGRWQRTVQAYVGAAVQQQAEAPAQNPDQESTLATPYEAPTAPLPSPYASQGANGNAKGPNYYPDVPRMSEDLYTSDQEYLMGRAQAARRANGKPHPRDALADAAAAAVYPGYSTVGSDGVWRNPWDGPLEDLEQYMAANGMPRVPGLGPGPTPPKEPTQPVVQMSKTEAWARFTAYEACIQVCCANGDNEFSQHFQSSAFKTLREHLRVGALLLNPAPATQPDNPNQVSATNAPPEEICWVDSSAVRTVRMTQTGAEDSGRDSLANDIHIRVRVGGLILPGSNVLDRVLRWAGGKKNAPETRKGSDLRKLVVYVHKPDSQGQPLLQCPLGAQGQPLMLTSWTTLDMATGSLPVSLHSRQGLVAEASVSAESLLQAAQSLDLQEVPCDPLSNEDADMALCTGPATPGSRSVGTLTVPLMAGPDQGHVGVGTLVLELQRVRRAVMETEAAAAVAPLASENSGVVTFGALRSDVGMTVIGSTGDQMMRLNRNIAYDCLLSAALEVERCGPQRLTIEGPWQWLLTAYADQYGVSNAYRVLVHLQWILQPHIARTSQLCLSTICDSWRYLMAARAKGELTAQEDTMLTRIRRDAEELLKVAFIRYYVPQQPDGSEEGTPEREFEIQGWEAQHLQAAVLLYQEMAMYLQPSAREWLAQCWQTAAQKRWRALLAIGDPDKVLISAAKDSEAAPEPVGALAQALPWRKNQQSGSTLKQAGEAKVYQLVIALCKLIQEDITFDLNLKHEPGLLPPEPDLPRKTAEEYCAQFLTILRRVLDTHPPSLPTPQAMELLAAVAKMQRYLDVAGLQCDVQHPGHLNAFQLFQPHVLRWISASQQRLTQQCSQLEVSAKAQGSNMMIGAHNSSALVSTMLKAVGQELRCYEPVLRHWPRFAPALEASVCQVLRGVLAALSRQCELATGNAQHTVNPDLLPGQARRAAWPSAAAVLHTGTGRGGNGSIPGVGSIAGHKRATSVVDVPAGGAADVGPLTAGRGPTGAGHHARAESAVPAGGWDLVTTALRQRMRAGGSAGAKTTVPSAVAGNAGPASAGAVSNSVPVSSGAPHRMVVLMKEAVLLNSLKHIMVLVPEYEDDLTKWAMWAAGQAQQLSTEGQLLPDGVDIGVHFAQLVKELRSGYAEAVATCAGRMAEVLRGNSATNIRYALEPSRMSAAHPTQGVSNAQALKQALEEALLPVLAGIQEALSALRASLDTRVCVATGRALWDYVGKDLHLFVSALQERPDEASAGANSAWRARQNADSAAHRIDDCFRQSFTEILNGAVQACDLAPPAHMDKVHKLLQRNSAMINMAFIPF